jgi:putative addiction module component (TIGR02574 family)
MASRMKEITKEAIGLPKQQRLALAKLLLDLDQPAKAGDVEGAWDKEIQARVRAVDEGRAVGVPYEDIRKEMAARAV